MFGMVVGGAGRRFSGTSVALATVVLVAGLAGCQEAGATITRLAVGTPGPDPYAPMSGTDLRPITPTGQPAAAQPSDQAGGQTGGQSGGQAGGQSGGRAGAQVGGTRDGDSPGLYGGTRRAATCDPARLVAFLQANPEKAKAWAGTHGISPDRIPAFVNGLTPVLLRVDTLVTNHGYRDGKATSAPAVLQAGMGVLVDRYGFPVVKCNCGNPLTAPSKKISAGKASYSGASWSGFNGKKVTRVRPRGRVTSFVLVDPEATMGFSRPVATTGTADGPPVPLPPPTTTQTPSPDPSADPSAGPSAGVSESPVDSPSPGVSTESPGMSPEASPGGTGGDDQSTDGPVEPETAPGQSQDPQVPQGDGDEGDGTGTLPSSMGPSAPPEGPA